MYGNGMKNIEEAHHPVTLSQLEFHVCQSCVSGEFRFCLLFVTNRAPCTDVASPISFILPDLQLWSISILETSDCQSAVHKADITSAYSTLPGLDHAASCHCCFENLENFLSLWRPCPLGNFTDEVDSLGISKGLTPIAQLDPLLQWRPPS